MDLIEEFGKDVRVIRYGAGIWHSDGNFLRGSPTELHIVASVQNVSANEIMRLPEHLRTKEVIKIYSNVMLRTADEKNQIPPDSIEHNGKLYEVQAVTVYGVETKLPHYKTIASKLDGEG